MKYFSMFSGIGGFELGIYRMCIKDKRQSEGMEIGNPKRRFNKQFNECGERFTCVGYSELDKYAIQIYQKHFPKHKGYGDARRIVPEEIPDFDLLCGGFPCQSFSIAGKRGGLKDTRGTLFYEIARIASVKRPKLLFLENVKGLLSHDNGRTFGTILSTFSELGYICEWQVLNSKNFGVPQNRGRVFIVGHLGEPSGGKVFPIANKSQNSFKQEEIISEQIANTLRTNYSNGFSNETYTTQGTRIRRLTPTECERLQGFPDGWTEGISDTQRYKCLGNAVTVNVIEAIASRMFKQLREEMM